MRLRTSRFSPWAPHLLLFILFLSLVTGHSSLAQARPDPGFMPVSGPPFDAADIWVDSELNGFGTYFTGTVSSSRTPVGSGDPIRPSHVNRVYARVRNFGNATASNLTINFYIRQPAGIGDGGLWQLIGTLRRFGPVQPRSFRDGSIEWTPTSDLPVSLKVAIDPLASETSTANNAVIEGSLLVAADAFTVPEFEFLVHNPSQDSSTDLSFQVMVTPQSQATESLEAAVGPADWVAFVDPPFRHLRAGSDCLVHAVLSPPDPCKVSNGAPALISILGFFQQPGKAPAPLGGVTLFARTTKLGAIGLTCPESPTPVGTLTIVRGQLFEQSCTELAVTALAARNQLIVLEYRSPSGKVTMEQVRTSTMGTFSDRFTPDETGGWTVQGSWIGDATHAVTSSGPCLFSVAGCPPPMLTRIPDPIVVFTGDTVNVRLSVSNSQPPCNQVRYSSSPTYAFVTLIDNGDGTGLLRVSPVAARDLPGDYRLTITVMDMGTPPQSASQTITIRIPE